MAVRGSERNPEGSGDRNAAAATPFWAPGPAAPTTTASVTASPRVGESNAEREEVSGTPSPVYVAYLFLVTQARES